MPDRALAASPALAAILTGGASRRMGGRPKGLLPGPDGAPLALRAARVLASMDLPYILVGHPALYAPLGLPVLADESPGQGPLAGLAVALAAALDRGASRVLLVGCDMPYFTAALARRVLDAPAALAAAPRRGSHFEPLFARYDVALLPEVRRRLAAGALSMQRLLSEVGAGEVLLSADEAPLLDDWDTPEDMTDPR